MVPDFKISIPQAGGRYEQQLFELKVVSSCPTRYPRNPRPEGRAVDRRANLLQGEYTAKARKADRLYGNTAVGQVGKMEHKLLSYGRVRVLVVGAWGEISEDFKSLMEVMGDKKTEDLEAETGVEGRKSVTAQLASYVSHSRQQISWICVQAQSKPLYQARESSLVPLRLLTVNFLQKT